MSSTATAATIAAAPAAAIVSGRLCAHLQVDAVVFVLQDKVKDAVGHLLMLPGQQQQQQQQHACLSQQQTLRFASDSFAL